MPRENRKRGKKFKPQQAEEQEIIQIEEEEQQNQPESSAGPSWIVPAQEEEINPEAPFGYVDADVKAYFKTVDAQMRSWQFPGQALPGAGEDADVDPNAEKQMFFVAALSEMSGKEKQLATDPDCSVILERMSHSMDDFVRRVFLDTLAGSYEVLARHRFASHVCQTLLNVAADTVSREARGIYPAVPESENVGELRTVVQLVLDICEELAPSITSLIMNPFASHVLRALLVLLVPSAAPPSSQENADPSRSKRSANWKTKQGPMKSVFSDHNESSSKRATYNSPNEFLAMAKKVVEEFRTRLGGNEIRALGVDKVASPAMHILVAMEARLGLSNETGSLIDTLTEGSVSAALNDESLSPSDYFNSLLRDATASHLVETIMIRSPKSAFERLWDTYFKGQLLRIATHPVANFVLAKCVERLDEQELTSLFGEMKSILGRIFESARTGAFRAVIDRAAALSASSVAEHIVEALFEVFRVDAEEHRKLLIPCVLRLQHRELYHQDLEAEANEPESKASSSMICVQGAVLLQSCLRLPHPANQPIISSILSLPNTELIQLSHNPMSSRVLDVLLESTTVPAKSKREFILTFVNNDSFHLLMDDRIGSRVGDRCWASADTFLKKKIATSLIPHENFMIASQYGRFFAKNLNLYLLKKRPEEWVDMQSKLQKQKQEATAALAKKVLPLPPSDAVGKSVKKEKKRKRAEEKQDEIDEVFGAALGKKTKKGALLVEGGDRKPHATPELSSSVLGAIRSAPSQQKANKRRKD